MTKRLTAAEAWRRAVALSFTTCRRQGRLPAYCPSVNKPSDYRLYSFHGLHHQAASMQLDGLFIAQVTRAERGRR